MIDGIGDDVVLDRIVEIEGRTIRRIDPWGEEHRDTVLDLSELTIVPGLVDAHDHLGYEVGDLAAQVGKGAVEISLRAAANARKSLEAGVVALRDAGSPGGLAIAWRDAIDAGIMLGPTLRVAGSWITRTGGHGWYAGHEADGPADIRRAVRDQAKAGADWIKIIVTGGVLPGGPEPRSPTFSEKEIRTAVDEAHFVGMRCGVHAHGGPALRWSIEAGVDVVEHATLATPEDIDLMAERGVVLVATASVIDFCATAESIPPNVRERAETLRTKYLETLHAAREAGVEIAVGTDLMHGNLVGELEILIEAGFSTLEAVHAATTVGGRLLDLPEPGTLRPGVPANFVVVRGDVTRDVTSLRQIEMVAKDGRLITPPPTDHRRRWSADDATPRHERSMSFYDSDT